MTSLTKQETSSKIAGKTTAWQLSITFESPDYGALTLNETSSLTKSQSVWRSSKSQGYRSRQVIETVTLTARRTLESLDKLHQLTGMTLTVIKSAPGIWCDYCKTRFGANTPRGQKPASYTIVSNHPKSKGIRRHYCNACAIEVQSWADGTVWSLPEQTDYLMSQEELPNV